MVQTKPFIQAWFVALAAAATLYSQDATPPPGKAEHPTPAPANQVPYLAGFGPIGTVLTEEQRASFRQAMDAQREQMREIERKMRDARKKLVEASLTTNFDEAAVREQAAKVGALDAETAVIRARALSKIQPPLTTEQIEKIKSLSATAPLRGGPRGGERFPQNPERQHHLTSTNRDENNLPPKQ